jgi:hypothetical protein
MTEHFLKRYLAREYPISAALLAAFAFRALVLAFPLPNPLCHINLTHLNPNSILQISIFVHLCEAFLGVLPHFGLWRYLYHCRPGMAGGQHQLVGGASLEMRRGRKTEYLEIPLKDSIKGWRLEWFIVENYGNSLPSRWEDSRTFAPQAGPSLPQIRR